MNTSTFTRTLYSDYCWDINPNISETTRKLLEYLVQEKSNHDIRYSEHQEIPTFLIIGKEKLIAWIMATDRIDSSGRNIYTVKAFIQGDLLTNEDLLNIKSIIKPQFIEINNAAEKITIEYNSIGFSYLMECIVDIFNKKQNLYFGPDEIKQPKRPPFDFEITTKNKLNYTRTIKQDPPATKDIKDNIINIRKFNGARKYLLQGAIKTIELFAKNFIFSEEAGVLIIVTQIKTGESVIINNNNGAIEILTPSEDFTNMLTNSIKLENHNDSKNSSTNNI